MHKQSWIAWVGLFFAVSSPPAWSTSAGNASHAPSLVERLKTKGYSAEQCDRLVKSGVINPMRAVAVCNLADPKPIAEKYLLADKVIVGRIEKVTYLYKEGGPFRTAYHIRAEQVVKGDPAPEVVVVSPFGPNSKDHRRWKSHPARFEFEVGDQGLFFLDRGSLESLAAAHPAHAHEIDGKHAFLGDIASATYLSGSGGFDRDFNNKTGKQEEVEDLRAASRRFAEIQSILKGGEKK